MEGSGVGLALAQQIARAHGGEILLFNREDGEGASGCAAAGDAVVDRVTAASKGVIGFSMADNEETMPAWGGCRTS